tara:strand:- start:264 stop:476 length:213 start_codon:yes stop_codon:yes gene_type:complete
MPIRYTKQYISKCGEYLAVQNFKTNRFHIRAVDDLDNWACLVREVANGHGANGLVCGAHFDIPHITVVLG